jgi:phosphomevalonate kinase
MPRSTVISAPGKVLITGGYLVLDPAYQGTVISTSSRFYTVISNSPIVKKREVVVTSPQFLDAQWEYHVQFPQDNSGKPIRVTPSPHGTAGDNRFVHLALNETMKLAQSIVGMQGIANALTEDGEEMGLSIVIVGDNDFYSQRRNVSRMTNQLDG